MNKQKFLKRICIPLAFVLSIAMFGFVGSACTTPTANEVVDGINLVTTADVFKIVKDLYKQTTGQEIPAVVADKLNNSLVTAIADHTNYAGITRLVSKIVLENTGISLPADTLAVAIAAIVLFA